MCVCVRACVLWNGGREDVNCVWMLSENVEFGEKQNLLLIFTLFKF